MRAIKMKLTVITVAALAMIGASAVLVASASVVKPPTRAEYARLAEPLCKRSTAANKRLLKGVRAKVQHNMLKPASRQFARAAHAFMRAVRQITSLPRPAKDRVTISRWLQLLKKQVVYLRGISNSLRAGNRFKSQRISVLLSRNADEANRVVLQFRFRHCRIRPGVFL